MLNTCMYRAVHDTSSHNVTLRKSQNELSTYEISNFHAWMDHGIQNHDFNANSIEVMTKIPSNEQ